MTDNAALCAYLDEHDRQALDQLRESLKQLPDEADSVRKYRSWVAGFTTSDDLDVNGTLSIWREAEKSIERLTTLDHELHRACLFDSPEGIHSRSSAFMLGTSEWQAWHLVCEADELVKECRAFATVAARQRGIIGPGAELTDEAFRELAVTVRPPAIGATKPTAAPPLSDDTPTGKTRERSGEPKPSADRPRRNQNQPSKDRQNDILAAIAGKGMPLTRPELVKAMRLPTEGKLGHHLAWMTETGILVNIPNRGYWFACKPAPE